MQAPHIRVINEHGRVFTFPNGAQQTLWMAPLPPHGRPRGPSYTMDTLLDTIDCPQGPENLNPYRNSQSEGPGAGRAHMGADFV